MAARAAWKGFLKISLVNIPVQMFSAAESSAKISFNRLHADCKGRTNNKIHCPACAKDIANGDCIKGYEYAKGLYVTFTDGELDDLADDASAVMEITTVNNDPISPVYIDGVHYLRPQDGHELAFETIRRALGGRIAIADVTLRDRPTQVALVAAPEGFLVYKLRAAEQVRSFAGFTTTAVITPSTAELTLANQLLNSLPREFNPETRHDVYTTRVLALVKAKVDGTAPPVIESTKPHVVSFTEALTQSLKLAQIDRAAAPAAPMVAPKLPVKAGKPAKAAAAPPAQKRKHA